MIIEEEPEIEDIFVSALARSTFDFVRQDWADEVFTSQVGKASCMRAYNNFVAVGTELGLVVLYSLGQQEQVRKSIIGTLSNDAIVSMDFLASPALLLCGHKQGDVSLWSTDTYLPVKRVTAFKTSQLKCVRFFETLSGVTQSIHVVALDSSGNFKQFYFQQSVFSAPSLEQVASAYVNLNEIPKIAKNQEEQLFEAHEDEEPELTEDDRLVNVESLPSASIVHPLANFGMIAAASIKTV